MPINPGLVIRVAANTKELKANLADAQDQIEVTSQGLQKMAASLSLDNKFIASAHNMVAAVNEIGGVTKLTEAEQAKINDTLQRAIEKYDAMGKQAPQSMRDLEAATRGANDSTGGFLGTLQSIGSSWAARIAEGVLLRDAIHEIINKVTELAEALPELALKGAVISDVEESFDHLTASAGRSADTLMNALRRGTHGTVDDFTLMKLASGDLAAGLDLTDAQFGLLAQGAFALSKATGKDVTTSLDTMNEALVTARAKSVAALTGKVDLTSAEERFAESLGKTRDHLTEEGKLQADRQAILDAVGKATDRLGEQTDSLDDKVAQAKSAWANFQDELGKSIARSPVIAAGFDSIRTSIVNAFGGNQQQAIESITGLVNSLAIKAVDLGIGMSSLAGLMVQAWGVIKLPIIAVEQVVVGLTADIITLVAKVTGLAAMQLAIGGAFKGIAATTAEWSVVARGAAADLHQQFLEAQQMANGTDAVAKKIDQFGGMLFVARDAMVATTTATKAHTEAQNDAGEKVKKHGDYLKDTAAEILKFREALEAISQVGADWKGTLDTIDGSVLEAIKYYADAGVPLDKLQTLYGLTATQIRAVSLELAAEKEAFKIEQESLVQTTQLWNEYFALRTQQSGTAFDAQRAQIEAWRQNEIAKLKDSDANWLDHYTAINAVADQKLDAIGSKWAQIQAQSQEALEQTADAAERDYQRALDSGLHFTSTFLDSLRKTADDARAAADNWTAGMSSDLVKTTDTANGLTNAIAKIGPVGREAAAQLADAIDAMNKDVQQAYEDAGFVVHGSLSGLAPSNFGGARASGGDVLPGLSYLVGERGPEIFQPSTSGTILPASATAGALGGGISVVVHVDASNSFFDTPASRQKLGQLVGDAVQAKLRLSGKALA